MAFLDNSGDILLDAVLTDTGRKRLSQGNGSFNIQYYSFGDDEINYDLYRNANSSLGAHPSGSDFYDLQILQTPILEAFANNASSMKSKLLTITRNDHLYLPVILPFVGAGFARDSGADAYVVAVDLDTVNQIGSSTADDGTSIGLPTGVLNGYNPAVGTTAIRTDQGINNAAVGPELPIDQSLKETAYLVQMDNRLGKIYPRQGKRQAQESFIDDDNIATYYLTQGTDGSYVMNIDADQTNTNSSLAGARGTKLIFQVGATTATRSDNYYFTTLGTLVASPAIGNMSSYYYIDSMVSITGVNTGYRVDLPIRYVKKS
jgi:hypothetical protein